MKDQRYQNSRHHVLPYGAVSSESAPETGSIRISILAVVLCAMAVFGLGVDYLLQPQRFPMKHINVEGDLVNTHPSQIQKAIAQVVSSSNILRVDVSRAVDAAQALPWVENAKVNRKWPDTLEVRVNERVVRAHWNDDRWIDQTGVVLTLPNFSDESLPRLRGADGSAKEVLAKYRMLDKTLRQYGLQVQELAKSERGSWDLLVQVVADDTNSEVVKDVQEDADRSVRVILGSRASQHRVERFVRLYSEVLRDVVHRIQVVDMRYPDGVSVRWKDKAPRLSGIVKLKNS